MTTPDPAPRHPGLEERLLYAGRQFVAVALVLFLLVWVVGRIEPIPTEARGIGATPFLWALAIWALVLVLNALIFQHSQLQVIEGWPLAGAMAIGALTLVVGLLAVDAASFDRILAWSAVQAVGAVLFWWGLFSLAAVLLRHRDDSSPT